MKKRLFLLLACSICLGCRTHGGAQRSAPEISLSPDVPAPTVQPAPEARGFSWKKALQFAGFQQSAEEDSATTPQRLTQLTNFARTVATKSSALDERDSPEVTRQKANELLDALRPWESLLHAGRTFGAINDTTAQHLNGFVKQLRIETSNLIQFNPNPQTIGIVKKMGNAFQATCEKTAVIAESGFGLSEALSGASRG